MSCSRPGVQRMLLLQICLIVTAQLPQQMHQVSLQWSNVPCRRPGVQVVQTRHQGGWQRPASQKRCASCRSGWHVCHRALSLWTL